MSSAEKTHSELIVVDPAAHTPETDCFNHISRLAPLHSSYHLPGICGLATLHQANQRSKEGRVKIAGIIVLGSATSVHDQLPWQTELAAWIGPHILGGVPFFGICFGHQLLAYMHGGTVEFVRDDQEKLKGFYRVELQKSRLAPAGSRSLLRSHREAVTSVPAGFHVMATSTEVAIDGLEHDTLPVWSLQTHPEATSGFLANQGIEAIWAQDPTAPVTAPESSPHFQDGWGIVQHFLNRAKLL